MASITHSSSSLLPLLTPPPHQKLHPLLSPRRLPSKVPSFSAAVAPPNPITIDNSSLILAEATSDEELLAATCLRVRSFYHFKSDSFSPEDYKKYLVEREFKGLKDRVAGNRKGFRRVSCINASLPLSHLSSLSEDLCNACKFLHTGEQQVVIGTLDLNQCVKLPDEITGMKPEGIGSDFARAYLSNVCVAKELHKKGLGYVLISKAKSIAEQWGNVAIYNQLSYPPVL